MKHNEAAIDRFRRLMEQIHELIEDYSEELTYPEGIFIVNSFRAEADWVQEWLDHGAFQDVIQDQNARVQAHLDLYKLRDRLDAGEDWDPGEELGEGK
jgi:hypothetical protein